jgi:DNA-binding helix-hairpin-helix protein with protein kinase domain
MKRPPKRQAPVPRAGDTVRTCKGELLVLGERLGGGLQGSVYGLRDDPDHCVKLFGDLPRGGELALRDRIDRLAALRPAPSLVLPQVALEVPHVGYVMARVHGHQTIGELCEGKVPLREWFNATGGLRKRLMLGQNIARAFQELHTRGLHYGDISFGNLLVSTEGTTSLRLIDCDNLSLDGACEMGVQGTPWFIAPEILNSSRPPSATTDAWSLAVILYLLLCLRHPLLGDTLRAAPPEAEEEALRGRFRYPWPVDRPSELARTTEATDPLPWVDHAEDDRNRSTAGLGPKYTVSAGLMKLFERVFEGGLRDPSRRPPEGEWAEALGRAVDAVLLCPKCGSTSYLGKTEICPWCDAPLAAPGLLHLWHPDGKRPLTVERRRLLYPRHISGRTGSPDDQPVAEVELVHDALRLTARSCDMMVIPVGKEGSPATQRLSVGRSVLLHRGDLFFVHEKGPKGEVVRP